MRSIHKTPCLIFLTIFCFSLKWISAQTARNHYDASLEFVSLGAYQQALYTINKAIEKDSVNAD